MSSSTYEVVTMGDVAAGASSPRAIRRSLRMGSVADVVRDHGGPYVIFGVGVVLGIAVGAAVFGGKKRG